ncbi:hypothetical protein HYC85_016926 [Camellia sinensis]|uniref:Uncharacterized protein n=1 Tax=Camellia sinensis TaxID=4442 RepID=A0A7J7H4P6_CAMSI|nr:hypothetical protein HYC85_016926 [Camellia sinensis]
MIIFSVFRSLKIREIDNHLCLSPTRSLIWTTAIAGENAVFALTVDDLHFPPDLGSIQDRNDEALLGEALLFFNHSCELL